MHISFPHWKWKLLFLELHLFCSTFLLSNSTHNERCRPVLDDCDTMIVRINLNSFDFFAESCRITVYCILCCQRIYQKALLIDFADSYLLPIYSSIVFVNIYHFSTFFSIVFSNIYIFSIFFRQAESWGSPILLISWFINFKRAGLSPKLLIHLKQNNHIRDKKLVLKERKNWYYENLIKR